MRKTVQFALLFTVIASTLSLSATVLDRLPATPEVATVTSAPDFGGGRDFRPEVVPFTLDRPSASPSFVIGNGDSSGAMFVNLDRPQFYSRSQGTGPNAPVGTPEPGSLALLASGLLSGVYFVRRRK